MPIDVPAILNYGLAGFAFFVLLFAFLALWRGRRIFDVALYMAFSLVVLLLVLGAHLPPPAPKSLVQIKYVKQSIPEVLLRCDPEPHAPDDQADDAKVAEFMMDLAMAGRECRSRLASVRRLILETSE